jgi:uncharacterized protein YbaR (Trm112 family)
MFNTTASLIRCPKRKRGRPGSCEGELELFSPIESPKEIQEKAYEVHSGMLRCRSCKAEFPILAGIAVLVDDVRSYLLEHVKGIAKVVPDKEIPARFRDEFLEAKDEIVAEHIEEDLEADRVTSLYLLNHYLKTDGVEWWKPRHGKASPVIDQLIREYWDHGPFAQIESWVEKSNLAMVELGCGVGGLCPRLLPKLKTYLGVDSSFASIALARHLVVGAPYPGQLKVPEDLLQGPVSRELKIDAKKARDGRADFVVGDLADPPLKRGSWDVSVALNTIDMLDEPADLPKLQNALVKTGGAAVQSCPYIWHEAVAKNLRKHLPKEIKDSAAAVEWLYQKAGFKIEEKVEHLPWLFFKHARQLEIYSVHLFQARKT